MIDAVKKAQLAVNAVRALGVGAAIVGGYARDTIYGRPVKDVDVLVEVSGVQEMLDVLLDIRYLLDANLVETGGTGYRDSQKRSDGSTVHGVYKATTSVFGYPVDVIFTDDIEQFIEGFPDDLSKVVFDGTSADPRPESLADYIAQRITYYREEWETQDRQRRLREKYPGFTFVYKPRLTTSGDDLDA